MEKLTCFSCAFFLALLTIGIGTVEVKSDKVGHEKLFVFGDSYVDTGNLGNIGRNLARSWYKPYGMTFPHRPTGRFSDGRLITDFIASFLSIKSPVPYKFRKLGSKYLSSGMNFAVAGSGVFDTGNLQPTLSSQIDNFQQQIIKGVFTKYDVQSAVAFVSINGNDYSHYAENHSSLELFAFISNVTSQIKIELKRLSEAGVRKVVVSNLSPLECTPDVTRKRHNYTQCDDTLGLGPLQHNQLLVEAVKELNAACKNNDFLILDLYSAFISVIKSGKGVRNFKQVLKPCCEGKTEDVSCGWVGSKGEKLYSLCRDPENYFYFDAVHPTQAGWIAVFAVIKPWLAKHL